MSHEIFGQMAGYARRPAWHGLGQTFDTAITASDAVKAIGADFNYSLEPLVAAIKNPNTGARTAFKIKDKMAIVREAVNDDPMPEVMGIVSPDYEIIQNMQFAAALDNLTHTWPVETLGVLKGGRTVFFTLKVGGKQLGSSTIEKYFLVTDSKTGKESAKFLYTPIRVECQNCLTAALKSSAVQGTLVHNAGVGQEFSFRTSLMSKLLEIEQEVDQQFEAMTKALLTIEQRDLVFKAYWPMPKKNGRAEFLDLIDEDEQDSDLKALRGMGMSAAEEFERLTNRSAVVQSELNELYLKFNDEYPDHANTLWAAWNVAVEHADFMNTTDNTGYAALFGDRVKRKRRAFDAALTQL
jgi:hypothetical protein